MLTFVVFLLISIIMSPNSESRVYRIESHARRRKIGLVFKYVNLSKVVIIRAQTVEARVNTPACLASRSLSRSFWVDERPRCIRDLLELWMWLSCRSE